MAMVGVSLLKAFSGWFILPLCCVFLNLVLQSHFMLELVVVTSSLFEKYIH